MTSNEIVPIFAQHTASALKEAPEVDQSQFNSLQVKAMDMMRGVTSLTPAVQGYFPGRMQNVNLRRHAADRNRQRYQQRML